MTRINYGIHPATLIDQHLLAEYRELPRIPLAIKTGRAKINYETIPESFTLGTGHVRFFYNKMAYLEERYDYIKDEINRRGFKSNYLYSDDLFNGIAPSLFKYPIPSLREIDLIKSRIAERVLNMNNEPKFYGKNINGDYYITKVL